jgi:O-methyltransferase
MIKDKIHDLLRSLGFDFVCFPPVGFRSDEREMFQAVRPLTITSPERVYVLIQAVRNLSRAAIPGAVVECGVWKGGGMAAVARTFLQMKDVSRNL